MNYPEKANPQRQKLGQWLPGVVDAEGTEL